MSNGKTNRTKGFNAERLYAKEFRDLGFSFCKTTRESSKLLDSCKIDLDFIPYRVQIKAGRQKGLNYSKLLEEIILECETKLPKEHLVHTLPVLIIHHKQGLSGVKRKNNDTLVIMNFETFKNNFICK